MKKKKKNAVGGYNRIESHTPVPRGADVDDAAKGKQKDQYTDDNKGSWKTVPQTTGWSIRIVWFWCPTIVQRLTDFRDVQFKFCCHEVGQMIRRSHFQKRTTKQTQIKLEMLNLELLFNVKSVPVYLTVVGNRNSLYGRIDAVEPKLWTGSIHIDRAIGRDASESLKFLNTYNHFCFFLQNINNGRLGAMNLIGRWIGQNQN